MPTTSLIVTIVRKGWGNAVLEASVKAGAQGGTVLLGRGSGRNERQKLLGIPIEPEKEILLTVAYSDRAPAILDAILDAGRLNEVGAGLAFIVPVEKVVGLAHLLVHPPG